MSIADEGRGSASIVNIEPIDMSVETTELFERFNSPSSSIPASISSQHNENENQQVEFSQTTSGNSGIASKSEASLVQSIQELYSLVANEISDRGITKAIFAKVVLNETAETLDRIFQCKGVGYDYFLQMIRTFLSCIHVEERMKRYRNVARALAEGRENNKTVSVTREEILDVIQQAKAEMSRMNVTQMLFAKVVLGRTAGIVSQMFKFNGMGYEKHIHTIRNFLGRPISERHMLYKKGVAPLPSSSQQSRLPQQTELHRTPLPTGLVQEVQLSENATTVDQVSNYAVYATKQRSDS